MLFDPAIWTVDEVQEILDNAKAALKQGQSVVSWTSLGSSAQMTWNIHPLVVIREATQYFKKVDPDTYGGTIKTGQILHGD